MRTRECWARWIQLPQVWIGVLLLGSGQLGCGSSDETTPQEALATSQQALTSQAEAINAKWVKMGGAAAIGEPTSGVEPLPAGLNGEYQAFSGGCIVSSDDFGAMFLTNATCAKYFSLERQTEYSGNSVLSVVGLPVEDTAPFGTGSATSFTGGKVIVTSGGDYVVYGGIYARYLGLAPVLGLPLSDEQSGISPAIRFQHFENGSMFWRSDVGAFAVRGAILDKWNEVGGLPGQLRFPLSDTETLIDPGGVVIGLKGRFEQGNIYYSPGTGARVLSTKLAVAYEQEFAGPNGDLGLPIGDLATSSASGYQYVDFERGVLVDTNPAGNAPGEVKVFSFFDFYVDRFDSFGDSDCEFGLCGTPDPYWYIRVWDETGAEILDKRWGNANDTDWTVQESWRLPTPSGARSYTVRFHGLDVDDTSDDDDLGTTESTYNIDNLWGTLESNDHRCSTSNGGVTGTYAIRNHPPIDPEKNWIENYWWSFKNFGTDNLTYEQFAATFSDVSNDEAWWLHPFNHFFYDVFFDGIASSGNCFGMSLESIYAQGGRSPYAQPIHQYFDDTQGGDKPIDQYGNPLSPAHASLINHINIKHGYQLGLDAVSWFFAHFLAGTTHDPNANFALGKAFDDSGVPTVVSIFDSEFFQGGHTMRVVGYEPLGPACGGTSLFCYRIHVADPNYPSADLTGDMDEYIEINPGELGQYRYHDYSGGFIGGGRLLVMPYWLLDHQPATPFGLGQQLLDNLTMLLTGSTGRVNQVTDEAGRTLFEAPIEGSPTWDDLTQDAAQRMPTLAPIPIAMDGPMPGQLYAGMHVVGSSHEYDLGLAPGLPAGTRYEATIDTARLASRLSIPGTPGVPDIVRASDIGTETKAMEVEIPAASTEKTIDWTLGAALKHRWAQFKSLTMVPTQKIRMRTANGGYRIIIENDGPDTGAVVQVSAGKGATPVDLGWVDIPGGVSELDFQLPKTTLTVSGQVPGNGGWLTEPVTITLDAVEYSGTGLDAIEYSLDGENWATYAGPFVYAEQGDTELLYRARDKEGNQEAAKRQTFRIDSEEPEAFGAVSLDGGVSLSYTMVDPEPGSGGLGVHTLVQGEAGPIEQFVPGTDGSIDLPTTCSRVEYWAEDAAGNLQLPHAIIEDSVPPVLTAPPVIHTTRCTEAAGLDFGVVADDDCGIVSLTSNAPAQMPLGTTLVTWEASDAAGNVVTVSQEITTELADDPSCCPAGYNIIMGTTNDDQLTGTSGSDCIIALGGQDKLYGLGGNDALSGGDGDDQLWGGPGNDWMYGGTGQDKLSGGSGDDSLLCGDGVDWAYGGIGNDTMFGGQGGDYLFGDAGEDSLWGEADDDHLDGGLGNDYLDGGLNHDWCQGGGGSDHCVQDGGDYLSGTCTPISP